MVKCSVVGDLAAEKKVLYGFTVINRQLLVMDNDNVPISKLDWKNAKCLCHLT